MARKTLSYEQARANFKSRPRAAQRAMVLYPHLADADARDEMAAIAKREGGGDPTKTKRGILSDATRGCISPLGGIAVRKGQ